MTRALGVGKESTFGQDVALSEYTDIIGESMKAERSIIADPTAGVLGLSKPSPGTFKVGGGFKFYAEPENMGLLLLALFGSGSDTPTLLETGTYKHTFTPQVTPQWLTGVIITDVAAGQKTVPGMTIKKATFNFGANQKVLVEMDYFGKTLNLDALATPTFSTRQPFHHLHNVIKFATVANTKVKAGKIEIERKYAEDDYRIGSCEVQGAPLEGMLVKANLDLMFDQLDQLKMFLGSSVATAPLTTLTKQRVDINFTHDTLCGATQYYQLNFCLLECLIKTHQAQINERKRTIENLELECFAPTSGAQMTAELVNSVATY
jgi:hypothetical protein